MRDFMILYDPFLSFYFPHRPKRTTQTYILDTCGFRYYIRNSREVNLIQGRLQARYI